MASVINAPAGFDYYGELAKDLILRPVIATGNLEDQFKVVTDLKTKRQVVYVKPFDKITVIDTGCDSVPNNQSPTFDQKYWNPNPVEAFLSQCYKDVQGIYFEQSLKAGTQKQDITGTDFERLILDLTVPAAHRDLMRMVFMSKKTITAGELTSGAGDVKNYNQLDGIWVKIFAGVAAGLVARTAVAKNAGANIAAQQLTPQECNDLLQSVYDNQKLVFKQSDDAAKMYFVTRNVYEGYRKYLKSFSNIELSYALIQGGTGTASLTFEGIPLVIMNAVDSAIQSDFLIGGKYDLPTRVVLTAKDVLQIGMDTAEQTAFDVWQEKKDKRWYARLLYQLDTQIGFEEFLSVAY